MENICIPMHLDAFALSPDCCNGLSKIAPYTQPNYTALRLDSHLIQHDVLDHTDFHNTSPAQKNPRVADIGLSPPNNLKFNRMGIHLHWSLPRFYRTAKASGSKTVPSNSKVDPTNPTFRTVPNRWLVTRHLKNFKEAGVLTEYQSWIIESDAVRNITSIPDDVDLESDVAPFVAYDGNFQDDNILNAQTEIFLGQKFDLAGWKEDSTRKHTNLTLMNSSNPLFPDFALHNTNVFSIIDNFAYKKKPDDKEFSYLTDAWCDYFVIGWHQDSSTDPLNEPDATDLSSRLKKLMLQLDDSNAKVFGIIEEPTRCLVYGGMYDVRYNANQKPHSVADESAAKFTSQIKMEPLSIGTTPLDGILTFLEAHQNDADEIFGQGGSVLSKEILEMAQFLYASADAYDSRVQAQDLIAQQNFAKADGGLNWTFAKAPKPGGVPATPDETEAGYLRDINEAQAKLDICSRKLRSLRWELFAEWWKYVSEYIPDKKKNARQAEYRAAVSPIVGAIGESQLSGLLKAIESLSAKVTDLQKKVDVKPSSKEPYYTRSDPTLCIAGLDSGWPQDFLDVLTVKLHHELNGDTGAVSDIFMGASNPVPTDRGLHLTATRLLAELLKNASTQNGAQGAAKTTGFQAWGARNPFVPLFIEWESIYYHIDKTKWDVQLRPSPVGHAHSQVRYVPNVTLSSDPSNHTDFRSLSGRILVLPQPVFSLENVVLQLLDSAPKDLRLTPAERDDVRNHIKQIKFISASLAGLTSHLLTRCEGAHVKPNVREQGQTINPLKAAAAVSQVIGIDGDVLRLVDAESALTPYGTLLAFGTDQYPGFPFKGVTHGQMIFTKLNIIDKFGQAICLPVSAKPRQRHPPDPPESNIYPCLSDYLAPDVDEITKRFNTVFPTPDPVVTGEWPLCQYVQLTPAINQDARINASFMTRDSTASMWREASEYEQPIWGWIIINYADSGLQFFLPDGSFYREIRMGGLKGVNVSAKFLPYEYKPIDATDAATAQLDQLIKQLSPEVDTDGSYLQSFFNMINGSIQNMPFPPSDYSGYANAIVGKPLALVNIGWSIEVAAPAIKPQNSLGNRRSDAQTQAELESYNFPLKIGDSERNFDGVVGYYLSSNDSNPRTDWSTLYTYFPSSHPKVQDIIPSDYPKLHPYYLQPETTTDVTRARSASYTVTSILIDPYTSIHGYSPILPTKILTLPPWTIQAALQKIHAFFHLGPNLVTQDVPATYGAATAGGTVVKLPVSGRKGTWTWLQPYPTAATATAADDSNPDRQYVQFDVQEDLGQNKFEVAPYTFIEGYLQLMGSLQSR